MAMAISTSGQLKNPQNIVSNNERKQHRMQSKTLHPFYPKWETNQTQNAWILRQTCSKIQQSPHLPLWPASQPWQFARRGSHFPLHTGHAASRPSRWQAVPLVFAESFNGNIKAGVDARQMEVHVCMGWGKKEDRG